MNNIFENAYFGKAYKTRDEEKALYSHYDDNSNLHKLFTYSHIVWVDDEGFVDEEHLCLDHPNDIVSEWQEEINEEELAKQYVENSLFGSKTKKQIAYCAYLKGYRKALEQ